MKWVILFLAIVGAAQLLVILARHGRRALAPSYAWVDRVGSAGAFTFVATVLSIALAVLSLGDDNDETGTQRPPPTNTVDAPKGGTGTPPRTSDTGGSRDRAREGPAPKPAPIGGSWRGTIDAADGSDNGVDHTLVLRFEGRRGERGATFRLYKNTYVSSLLCSGFLTEVSADGAAYEWALDIDKGLDECSVEGWADESVLRLRVLRPDKMKALYNDEYEDLAGSLKRQ